MCNRMGVITDLRVISTRFNARRAPELPERGGPPRPEIRPTDQLLTIALGADGARKIVPMRWGLVPHWEAAPKTEYATFNARSEKLAGSKAFGPSFEGAKGKGGRCLIPFDVFYEWTGTKTPKQKHKITTTDNRMPAFAGLWASWRPKGGAAEGIALLSCSIITVPANADMKAIHDRMPAILPEDAYPLWLGEAAVGSAELQGLLQPYPAGRLVIDPPQARAD
ncbi:SOS response-associated peptidase [Ferrovibrio terrae]|uniref:SOS response-associated peptidase n=1 Tax=Ferrovibrio terrae TaxID=2594003 RepID=UPI003137824C